MDETMNQLKISRMALYHFQSESDARKDDMRCKTLHGDKYSSSIETCMGAVDTLSKNECRRRGA